MTTSTGKFVWYELLAADTRLQAAFYQSVMGWQSQDGGVADCAYTLFSAADKPVGGMMVIPAEAHDRGLRSCWTGYISVDDVDGQTPPLIQAGGSLLRPAEDIPGIGRFAVAADPDGAAFILFKGVCAQPPEPVPPGTPGHVGWHELHAGQTENPLAFYSELFGWQLADTLDMNEMGPYRIFSADGISLGGMMRGAPKPFWLFYFNVAALDAALDRVAQAGGKVIMEPMQVPGGLWVANCLDPEQAMFALVAPQR